MTTSTPIIVIKIGGSVLDGNLLPASLIEDLRVLLGSSSTKVVIVHGSGPLIDKMLADGGRQSRSVHGLRVTDAETLETVRQALVAVNGTIVDQLRDNGIEAIGYGPNTSQVFTADKLHITDEDGTRLDIGFVGAVKDVLVHTLTAMLDQSIIPVIAPFGEDQDGVSYNLNADHVAQAIASSLGATKLINMTDVPGVLQRATDPNSRIHHIHAGEVSALREQGIISGGMLPKIQSCLDAIQAGVSQVHILDGRAPGSLITALKNPSAIGTVISGAA